MKYDVSQATDNAGSTDGWMLLLVYAAVFGPMLVILGITICDNLGYPAFWRDTFTRKRLLATALVTLAFVAIWLLVPDDFKQPGGTRYMRNPMISALICWFVGWGHIIYSRDTNKRGMGIVFLGLAILGIAFSLVLVLFWKFG